MQRIFDILFADGRFQLLIKGFGTTVLITIFALVIGIVIGTVVAILKIIPKTNLAAKIGSIIADIYLAAVRGTPIMVLLMIMYYVVFKGSFLPALYIAIIGFGINSGAYVAEIMRSGILAVDIGQTEAGRSLGLSYTQTLLLIVLPQAVKNILPALVNEVIALIKETSVASAITVIDFFNSARIIVSITYDAMIPYLFTALVYILTVVFLTFLLGKLENSLRKGDKKA